MTAIWIPILGGLMFSAGLIGLLLVLETWIYDFGEEDVGEEEEEDGEEKPVGRYRMFLNMTKAPV